jgi:mRNA interferase RelE/StbE
MRRIVYTRLALKQMNAIPEPTATRIRSKIEQYAADPSGLAGNVVKLQAREGYRLRVGDYRVIFDDDGTVLDILGVGPRGSIYG